MLSIPGVCSSSPEGEVRSSRASTRNGGELRRQWLFLGLLVVFGGWPTQAQTPSEVAKEVPPQGVEEEAAVSPGAPVRLDGRTLFELRGASAFPAEERAALVSDRIRSLAADRSVPTSQLRVEDGELMTSVLAGDQLLVSVIDADGRREELSRQELALVLIGRIREAVELYRSERDPRKLLRTTGLAAVNTLLLVLVLLVGRRALRWMRQRIEGRYRKKVPGVRVQSFDLLHADTVWALVEGVRRTLAGLLVLALVYVYLRRTLSLFPWTRFWTGHLLDLVLEPLRIMGEAVIAELPNLAFVAVLFVVTRYLLKGVRLLFAAVGRGAVSISGFQADWAQPTYKIVRLMVVAFAVVIAFPYLPGSDTAAFKGVSIFLGVIFSLGGSSLVGNIVAGHTMTYRRAFKVGDVVTINDTLGRVTEMRLLVTHLRTLRNEEVVIPNSLILNSNVVNHSSYARAGGLIVGVTVGIGYEVPWRQVEALLLLAAERTHGRLEEPAPFVLQKSLGDFAITYELCVYYDDPASRFRLVTRLHQNVLDVFNEYGVQIMTPNYERDPEHPKLVPPNGWFAAPARDTSQAPQSIEESALEYATSDSADDGQSKTSTKPPSGLDDGAGAAR